MIEIIGGIILLIILIIGVILWFAGSEDPQKRTREPRSRGRDSKGAGCD